MMMPPQVLNMTHRRDDFRASTIRTLAQRVGYRCSNPDCRNATTGPHSESDKATIVGIAAHISAAAPGGPRYDPTLTSEERRAPENGIWLCRNCSGLIDTDSNRFPVELLYEWKFGAENRALSDISVQRFRNVSFKGQDGFVASAQNVNDVGELAGLWSTVTEHQLEITRQAWRTGDKHRALEWLRETKGGSSWSLLSNEVKAKILSLEGGLELDDGNTTGAKKLADEAADLAAIPNVARLQALIAFQTNDAGLALDTLAPLHDVDSVNLCVALLLDAGKSSSSRIDRMSRNRDGHESAIQLFDGPPEHRNKGLKLELFRVETMGATAWDTSNKPT